MNSNITSFSDCVRSLIIKQYLFLKISNLEGISSRRQPRFELATRSLATFVCSHRPLRSIAQSLLCSQLHYPRFACSLAPFTGSLTHFSHSLVGQLTLETRPYSLWRDLTLTNNSVAKAQCEEKEKGEENCGSHFGNKMTPQRKSFIWWCGIFI